MRTIERFSPVWFVCLTFLVSLVLIAAGPASRPSSTSLPTSQPKHHQAKGCSLSPLPKVFIQPPKKIGQKIARTLLYTGGLRSYFEPCGCQADMLGGFTRLATLVESYRREGHQLLPVDAGNLFFEKFIMAKSKRKQNQLKAELIADLYQKMGVRVIGFGPHDLVLGRKFLRKLAKRSGAHIISSNVVDAKTFKPILPTKTIQMFRGLQVGFLSLTATPPTFALLKQADGDKAGPFPKNFWKVRGVKLLPSVVTAQREVKALRAGGAQVIVLLSTLGTNRLKTVLEKVKGIHLAIDGFDGVGIEPPQKVGGTLLLAPPKEGKKLGVFSIFWHKGMKGWKAIQTRGKIKKKIESNLAQMASYQKQAKMMQAQGAAFKPIADVYRKQASSMGRKNTRLKRKLSLPIELPSDRQGFVHALVPLSKQLLDCRYVSKRVAHYQKDVKRANVEALRNIKPILTNKQGNSYIGAKRCRTCHVSEYNFWKKTRHANAYATLVKKKKQFDLDCIGCHVVGWQKPGGLYQLQKNKRLVNVQCENCHSYGAIHATKMPSKKTIEKLVPASVCKGCHQMSHDPKFNYLKRLRKILGKGHGEKRLIELLRQHNLKK